MRAAQRWAALLCCDDLIKKMTRNAQSTAGRLCYQ